MVKTESRYAGLTREEFIQKNMGLVHACAGRFRGRGIEYDDLVKAADAFDETRGVQFSTYAVPVILGEIRRLFRDGGAVKVSRSLKELAVRTAREREKFMKEHFREPSVSELAAQMNLPAESVAEALGAGMPTVSLTGDPEEGGSQIDIPVESPEGEIGDMLSLQEVIRRLEEKDQRLIILRYFKHRTQTETAKELSMTQVQVSRREKKILKILREQLE